LVVQLHLTAKAALDQGISQLEMKKRSRICQKQVGCPFDFSIVSKVFRKRTS
jgi:hypothetical protein